MVESEWVRWVRKALVEVLGRGGCISRVRGVSCVAGEQTGGFPALGDEEEGAAAGDGDPLRPRFSDGAEERTSGRG